MVLEIGLSITVILIILGVLFQSRTVFFLQLTWIFIINSFNTYSVDWENNYGTYEVANISNIHGSGMLMVMYNYLAIIAKNLGISYVMFNGILAGLVTLAIGFVVFRLSKKPSIVLSLMLIYPFIDNVIQKRWYYALGISVLGIYLYLKSSSNVKGILILFITAAIACQFHTGSILLLTLPLFLMMKNSLQNWFVVMVMILGIVENGKISALTSSLFGGVLSEKSTLYFSVLSTNSSVLHFFFWIIWQMAQAGVILYISATDRENKIKEKVWRLNVWAMCLIPLYMFDPVFSRLFRVVLVFNYIVIANSFWAKNGSISKSGLIAVMVQLTMAVVSLYVFDINSALGVQEMIYEIFENNYLLS